MKTICLVACASKKHSGTMPAKSLYNSALFLKSRGYAESEANEWFILSAKHGLLHPDKKIENYNVTLNEMNISERTDWAESVLDALRKIIGKDDTIIFLAGKKYREGLEEAVRVICRDVQIPMEKMRIGEQLQWLGSQ